MAGFSALFSGRGEILLYDWFRGDGIPRGVIHNIACVLTRCVSVDEFKQPADVMVSKLILGPFSEMTPFPRGVCRIIRKASELV